MQWYRLFTISMLPWLCLLLPYNHRVGVLEIYLTLSSDLIQHSKQCGSSLKLFWELQAWCVLTKPTTFTNSKQDEGSPLYVFYTAIHTDYFPPRAEPNTPQVGFVLKDFSVILPECCSVTWQCHAYCSTIAELGWFPRNIGIRLDSSSCFRLCQVPWKYTATQNETLDLGLKLHKIP